MIIRCIACKLIMLCFHRNESDTREGLKPSLRFRSPPIDDKLCHDTGYWHLARRQPDAQAPRREALEESAARADELAAQDDYNGAAVWRRIIDAVDQLANTTPSGWLH